jgi:hypothetical protein
MWVGTFRRKPLPPHARWKQHYCLEDRKTKTKKQLSTFTETQVAAATYASTQCIRAFPIGYIRIHILCEICFPSRAHVRKGTLIGSYRDATEPDITLQGRVGDGSDTDVQLGNHGSPLKIRSHFYTRLNCICFSLSAFVFI